jgi:transcriptional regulator with XRE-family HTH domain
MVPGPPRDETKRRKLLQLRDQGWPNAEIARRLGVSRQCIHQMLKTIGTVGQRPLRCAGCKGIISARALTGRVMKVLCLDCLTRRPDATFCQRLKALRLAAGLTQAELGRKSGVSKITIQSQEVGRNEPTRSNLAKLVAVLGEDLTRDLEPAQRPGGWTSEEEALLGTMPDEKVAERIGRSARTVHRRRTELGIPSTHDRRRREKHS